VEAAAVVWAGIAAAPAMKPAAIPALKNIVRVMLSRVEEETHSSATRETLLIQPYPHCHDESLESMTLNIIEMWRHQLMQLPGQERLRKSL